MSTKKATKAAPKKAAAKSETTHKRTAAQKSAAIQKHHEQDLKERPVSDDSIKGGYYGAHRETGAGGEIKPHPIGQPEE